MMRFFVTAFILFLGLQSQANAGEACYAAEQIEAENILRLHSELMVTTVTCRYGGGGEDLSRVYTRFTKINIALLHDAEEAMKVYYQKAFGGDGIEQLDQLRTRLANEFGQEIARVSAPTYCAERRDRVVALAAAPSHRVRIEAELVSGKSYASVCKGQKGEQMASRKARKGS